MALLTYEIHITVTPENLYDLRRWASMNHCSVVHAVSRDTVDQVMIGKHELAKNEKEIMYSAILLRQDLENNGFVPIRIKIERVVANGTKNVDEITGQYYEWHFKYPFRMLRDIERVVVPYPSVAFTSINHARKDATGLLTIRIPGPNISLADARHKLYNEFVFPNDWSDVREEVAVYDSNEALDSRRRMKMIPAIAAVFAMIVGMVFHAWITHVNHKSTGSK